MMKRILGMLLLTCMLCLVLAGCGESDLDKSKDYINQNKPTAENPKITLSFYLVTDTLLETKSLAQMQSAFNAITETQFKTHVEFINVTASEYEATLASELNRVEDAIESGSQGGSGSGNEITEYPRVKDTQMDIVLITSFDQLSDMIEKQQVLDLTSYIESTTYRMIKSTVTEPVLYGAALGGKYYAIPNAHVMGEYTYLLVDKNVAADYYYREGDITDWESTKGLRDKLTAAEVYDYSSDTPCYDVNAPVRLVKGQYADRVSYADGNYLYIESQPTVKKSEIFSSAFAISSYTVSAERAMQVLYAINTNKTLRTILQYGVAGTTYLLEDGVVTLKNDSGYVYDINSLYTGSIFALYPCADKSETAEKMAEWKKQTDELIVENDIVALTVSATEGGKVLGGNIYRKGAGKSVTVQAVADEGATFSGWFLNDEETAVSTSLTYTFTLNADAKLVAKFEK